MVLGGQWLEDIRAAGLESSQRPSLVRLRRGTSPDISSGSPNAALQQIVSEPR